MRLIACVFLLFLSNALLTAQTTPARKPAKVKDFGQLYSTFSWDVTAPQLRTDLGNTLAEAVIAGSRETAWPSGIASLTTRSQNRAKMDAYTLYYLTSLNKEVAVLVAPAAENRSMPADMQASKDIYFVVALDAVEIIPAVSAAKANTVAPAKTPEPPAPAAGSFAAQFDDIANGYIDGFANLSGAETPVDEDEMVVLHECTAPLEGARALYFTEDLLAVSTSFHAEFPSSTDPAEALKSYRKLVAQVQALKLSCCGFLQKQTEMVDGSRHSQLFRTFDGGGSPGAPFGKMIVEVRIDQTETFDKNGQAVPDWVPVLDIYEE